MVEDFIEALLIWSEKGPISSVEEWLKKGNLEVIRMRAGTLLRGTRADFEAAFNVDLASASRPFKIPIPKELEGQVASITIPELPRFRS